MPSYTKGPGEPWPPAARGLTIELYPGLHGPAEFSGAPDMVLQGREGVVIEGSRAADGPGNPESSLRFNDGCHRLQILGPLEIRGSDGRGIRITRAEEIVLRDLYCHDQGIEGIITGGCPNAVYEQIRVEDSKSSPVPGYPSDKRHGLYISGDGSNSVIRALTCRRVLGSGLQVNGAGMDSIVRGLFASELEFSRCGSGGTPPISLMACRDCTIERFCIDWTAGEKWCVLFADGQGANYACVGNALQTYSVPRGSYPSEEQGSHDNSFDPGQGWSPEPIPPEPPEPEPEPPPTDERVLHLIQEARAALLVIADQTQLAQGALALAETLLSPPAREG